MKPEEMDRLFRDELKNLEHVPGIEWNDEVAWNKINTQLRGGWNNPLTWTLSTIVMVGIYLIYQYQTPASMAIITQQKTIAAEITPVKIDSIKKESGKSGILKKPVVLKPTILLMKRSDSAAIVSTDTLSMPDQNIVKLDLKKKQLFNRFTLMNNDFGNPNFKFTLPHLSFLKLKVNNGFNLSNLAKSIEGAKNGGENFYYFYEYNKNYVPALYENSHPKFMINNTYTITNFNK